MEPASSAPHANPPANPFVGPQPLRTGQPIFARETEIEQLYYMLLAQRIVLFYSPSGAGKSSLLQAGLIPRLTDDFEVWAPVRVNLEPGQNSSAASNRYARSCTLAWESALPASERRPDAVLSSMPLAEYVASRPRINDSGNLVLLFDQFEEILTVGPLELDARRVFFEQIGALLRETHIWAVIALREDYLAPLDTYAELVPTHLRNRFRLDLFTREAAAEAIARISASAGRQFTPEALQKLVADLAEARAQQPDGSFINEPGPYVEPLQLQVAGRSLWQQLPAGQVTVEEADVARFGDVGAALADYYAAEVARVAAGDDRTERAIRTWFDAQLIAAGAIRGQVVRGEGKTGGLANDLVEALVHTHLVRGEQRLGATWYELAHDRLIRPVHENNTAWFSDHLSPLQKTAALWRADPRQGLLFAGKDLIEAKGWAEKNSADLESFERDFLDASQAHQVEIDAKKRTARTFRMIFLAVAALAVLAIAAFIWALIEESSANQTLAQSVTANIPVTLTLENGQAVALANLAYALRKDPNSLEVRAWITTLLARRSWWLPTASLNYGSNSPTAAALSPDGRLFATGSSGSFQLWNVATGQKSGAACSFGSKAPDPYVRRLVFSPDAKRLLVVRTTVPSTGEDWDSSQTLLQLWDVDSHRLIASLPALPAGGHVTVTTFSPDSKLAAVSEDLLTFSNEGSQIAHKDTSTTTVYNAATGQPAVRPIDGNAPVNSAAFSPDGLRLVTGDDEGVAQIWDAASGQPLGRPIHSAKNEPVLSVEFSPDGHSLLLATSSHAFVVDAATGRPLGTPFGDVGNAMTGASYGPDGEMIVTEPGAEVFSWNPPSPKAASATRPAGAAQVFSLHIGSQSYIDTSVIGDAFATSGNPTVTFSQQNGIQTWNASTGAPAAQDLAVNFSSSGGPNSLRSAFAPGGPVVYTGPDGDLLRLWQLVQPASRLLNPSGSAPLDMSATPSGVRIALLVNGKIVVTDQAGNPIGKSVPAPGWIPYTGPNGSSSGAEFSYDGTSLKTAMPLANGNDSYTVWNVSTGAAVWHSPAGVTQFTFSPYGPSFVVTVSNTVQAFDSATGAPLAAFHPPAGATIGSTVFNPSGQTAITRYDTASVAYDQSVIWDLRSGKTGGLISGKAEFVPGANAVLSDVDNYSSSRSDLYLYPLTSDGLSVTKASPWKLPVYFPAGLYRHHLSADGKFLLTVPTTDTVVQVRDMKTGAVTGSSMYPQGAVGDARFSPDGKIILIETDRGSGSQTAPGVQLWSAATHKPIGDWMPMGDDNDDYELTAGDRTLLIASFAGNSIHSYPVLLGGDSRSLAALAEAVAGYWLDARTQSTLPTDAGDQYDAIGDLQKQYKIPANANFLQTILSVLASASTK